MYCLASFSHHQDDWAQYTIVLKGNVNVNATKLRNVYLKQNNWNCSSYRSREKVVASPKRCIQLNYVHMNVVIVAVQRRAINSQDTSYRAILKLILHDS